MNIGAVIQARYSSTRLRGKVLRQLPPNSGITVLEQVIRRVKRAGRINDIVVATTTEEEAREIVGIAKKEGVKHIEGSTEDVLSRYYLAARENGLDVIVRITADCPCVDPEVIDIIVEKHLAQKADYTSNTLKRTFPRGVCVEAFNFKVLEIAKNKSRDAREKEHVTPYIYRRPTSFKIEQVEAPARLRGPDIRVTLDTEEDYALLCKVFDFLYPKNKYFGTADIIKLYKEKPWLKLTNEKVVQKTI